MGRDVPLLSSSNREGGGQGLKPGLTGNEPPDLLHYARQQPEFPHESTADQFFLPAQFEAYRELGYQAVRSAFDRIDTERASSTQGLWESMRSAWSVAPCVSDDTCLKLTGLYIEIEKIIALGALVGSYSALHEQVPRIPQKDLHVCMMQIHLMEQVFKLSRLDTYHGHPDNAGWMQLFRHYWSNPTFGSVWAATGQFYGAEFRNFCERRLRSPKRGLAGSATTDSTNA